MDFFADNMVKRIIGQIITNKDTMLDDVLIWKQMTKSVIRNFGLINVLNVIEEINTELSDSDWFENKYPPEIFKEKKEKKREFKSDNKLKNFINSKIKITDIARGYGLDTNKKGKTTCPFHNDTDPSLMLNDEKNVFYCFGCGAKGDIISFKKKMEELKNGN